MVHEGIPQGTRGVSDETCRGSSESVEPEAVAGGGAAAEGDRVGSQSEEVAVRYEEPTKTGDVCEQQAEQYPGPGEATSRGQDEGVTDTVDDAAEEREKDEGAAPDVAAVAEGAERRRGQRRRKPPARGGVRREKEKARKGRPGGDARGRSRERARIVCRKNAGLWGVAVIPAAGVVVRDEADGQAAGMSREFTPAEFRSVALIEDEAGGRVERVPLFVDEPMVFRLGVDWQGEGRKVGGVGVGHFIVIAPAGWKRLGDAPVDPEACVDSGYRAHYFFGSRRDGRPVEGFEERGVSSSVIVLNGPRVFDDSDQGEMFVGKPPVLEAPGMAVARVGEEGKDGWAETFVLDDERSLADVLGGREGWFFVRVYREGVGVAADSVPFRYMSSLREIRMEGEVYAADTLLLPGSRGHAATDVQIVADGGATAVAGVTVDGSRDLESDGGHIVCPPDPEAKELHISVAGAGGVVDVVVGMPRVWWSFSTAGETPEQWFDQAPRMTREEFRALGLAGAEIRIDVPDRVQRVGVGFGDEGATNYQATKDARRRSCVVPLGHFVDHAEIDRRLFQNAALGAVFADRAVDLLEISADAPPRIVEFSVDYDQASPGDTVAVRWRAEDCDGVTVSLAPGVGQVGPEGSCEIQVEHPTRVALTLSADGMADVVEERVIDVVEPDAANGMGPVARAKALGGWRTAKGFSLREVAAVRGADGLGIRIDRRRRSEHAINVTALERCVNEQR
ncbi:MAG: hypothetical protein OXT64_14245 [Gammaproteobacteria bacterium]|nr:hypothetical protein [Gammaproteobacteria bacterium]